MASDTPPPAPKGSVHVSSAVHRVLVTGGPVLIVAGVLLGVARPGTSLAWGLAGAGVALALVSRKTTPPDRGCAFCEAGHEAVPFLITGASVSLCPECAVAAAAKAAEELHRRGQPDAWARMFLAGLPDRAPLALSRPYVEAVIADDRSPEWIRPSVACCFRFGHHDLAQSLLEAIPEAERTALDWIELGYALGERGRHAEAIAATRRGEGPASAPWVLANCAWYELLRSPAASPEQLARWVADVSEARRLLAALPAGVDGDDARRAAAASFLGVEAELLRRLGDPAAALRALDAADAQEAPTGDRRVIRARALADLGRPGEARLEAEAALALVRPGARAAVEARGVIEALPPTAAPGVS